MTRDWAPAFLDALADTPNVSAAARAANVSRQAAYDRRKADPAFAAAWDDALERSTDALVGAMYRRAVEGVTKPVFYKGELCGAWIDPDGKPCDRLTTGARFVPWDVREYSDTLAIFLAKAHRPEVYRERSAVEHSGDLTIRVEYADDLADAPEAPPGAAGDPGEPEAV